MSWRHLSSRLAIWFVIGISAVVFVFADFYARMEQNRLRDRLQWHAEVLAESMRERIEPLFDGPSFKQLESAVERFGSQGGVLGVAVYDEHGKLLTASSGLATRLSITPGTVSQAITRKFVQAELLTLGTMPAHVCSVPLHRHQAVIGALALFQDASSLVAQRQEIWRRTILGALLLIFSITLIMLLVVRRSITGPIAKTAAWMKELRTGSLLAAPPEPELFGPLQTELGHFVRNLAVARATADEEARLRDAAESQWTAERLRVHVQGQLQGAPLFVVSNREPYMHVHKGKSVDLVVPASGLVTALEPILCACDGTWVAHGAGDADRQTVDRHDRLRVPPDEPHYTLRRVWLTAEEEQGYYCGFANEGLWPLCHLAHTRPLFRTPDWDHYQQVNRRFANAVLEEMAGAKDPVVLVQDYHFALLPRLIKESRPDARVAIFWHIPWPNAEAFGICPQQRELLDGLLGADLIGFHIQAHCLNFLETVDAALESRIEWERSAVGRKGHFTLVKPFPISVAAPAVAEKPVEPSPGAAPLLKALGHEGRLMGVGVDRVDYTKGIIERFHGIERFLEKYPAYQGQFTFVQIGAPSRMNIPSYHDLFTQVEAEAARINRRFQSGRWMPIVLLNRQHSHREIEPFYRAADLCMVTALHDGMNLVAKEYVATRDDDQGVLILSRFTGASRELRDALIVNPYDAEQVAEAIRFALEMDPEERKDRMQTMRRRVKDHNVYRWAANLLGELFEIRPEHPDVEQARKAGNAS